MQSLSFFFFMLGIIFITIGYIKNKVSHNKEDARVEYRLVPKSIYDEQIENISVLNTYSDMFATTDPIFTNI